MSEIRALLDMIDRKAPLLMRAGGGGLMREMKNRAVSEDDAQFFLELYRSGKTQNQIASITGWSQYAVGKALRSHNYISRDEQVAKNIRRRVLKFVAAGRSQRWISNRLNTSRSNIIRILLEEKQWPDLFKIVVARCQLNGTKAA